MIVMHWRQISVATFHRRGGALKYLHPLGRPHVPLFEGMGRQALRERMMVKGALSGLQCLPDFGFPAGTARVSRLVLPIHKREEDLRSPLLPPGGEGRVGDVLSDTFPPEVHQGRQGWYLLADLGDGRVTD